MDQRCHCRPKHREKYVEKDVKRVQKNAKIKKIFICVVLVQMNTIGSQHAEMQSPYEIPCSVLMRVHLK